MYLFRNLIVAILAVVLFSAAAEAAAKAKKKGAKGVRGTVVKVSKDSLTVKVMPGKKAPNAEATERTVKLSDATKIEKVSGKKANRQTSAAKVEDLTQGNRVILKLTGEQADTVQILAGKKKNK